MNPFRISLFIYTLLAKRPFPTEIREAAEAPAVRHRFTSITHVGFVFIAGVFAVHDYIHAAYTTRFEVLLYTAGLT